MLLPQSRQLNLIDQYRLVPGTESMYTFAFVILWIIKYVHEPGHLVTLNSELLQGNLVTLNTESLRGNLVTLNIELLQGNLVTLNIEVYRETWLLGYFG